MYSIIPAVPAAVPCGQTDRYVETLRNFTNVPEYITFGVCEVRSFRNVIKRYVRTIVDDQRV